MSVSIVVPFRPNGAERLRNWTFLRERYQRLYPGWEVVEGTCEPPWCKGTAVNAAVEASSGDVLVVADADVMVSPSVLSLAVGVLGEYPWVVPHEVVWRMSEERTTRLLAHPEDEPHPLGAGEISFFPRMSTAGGGMFVMWRKDWLKMDERFVEWGGEDISHGRVLDTLIGPHKTLPSPLWHLFHEPMECRSGRRTFLEASEELANRYYAAAGNKEEMEALQREHDTHQLDEPKLRDRSKVGVG